MGTFAERLLGSNLAPLTCIAKDLLQASSHCAANPLYCTLHECLLAHPNIFAAHSTIAETFFSYLKFPNLQVKLVPLPVSLSRSPARPPS